MEFLITVWPQKSHNKEGKKCLICNACMLSAMLQTYQMRRKMTQKMQQFYWKQFCIAFVSLLGFLYLKLIWHLLSWYEKSSMKYPFHPYFTFIFSISCLKSFQIFESLLSSRLKSMQLMECTVYVYSFTIVFLGQFEMHRILHKFNYKSSIKLWLLNFSTLWF